MEKVEFQSNHNRALDGETPRAPVGVGNYTLYHCQCVILAHARSHFAATDQLIANAITSNSIVLPL